MSKDGNRAIAIIPGISVEKDNKHAFVQIFDAKKKKSYYVKYDFCEFSYTKKKFEVWIGKNFFSLEKICLEIFADVKIKGELKFRNIISWPVTPLSPGVMGWYAYVPTMECYHGVLSFNHSISGSLEIDGDTEDFTGGKGYCEKDWGVSMPSSWIWMQTNHFEDPDVSFFASIAKIPWKKLYFTGFLAGFFYKGKIHRFATYTGAKVKNLNVTGNLIYFEIHSKGKLMKVSGERTDGVTLAAPNFGEMSTKIQESLASKVCIEYSVKGKKIFRGIGENAGLEFVGDIEELVKGLG